MLFLSLIRMFMRRFFIPLVALLCAVQIAMAQQPLHFVDWNYYSRLTASYDDVGWDNNMVGVIPVARSVGKKEMRWGLVDYHGREIVPTVYEQVLPFGASISGYFPFVRATVKKNTYDIYSLDGQKIIANHKTGNSIHYDPTIGFYEYKKGKQRIPHTLWLDVDGRALPAQPHYFSEVIKVRLEQMYGQNKVWWNQEYLIYHCTGKEGQRILHDRSGERMCELPKEATLYPLISNRVFISVSNEAGKKGLLSIHGEELIPMAYHTIYLWSPDQTTPPYFLCWVDEKQKNWVIYDLQGIQLVGPYYGEVTYGGRGQGFRAKIGHDRYLPLEIFLKEDGTLDPRTEALADVPPQIFFEGRYDPAEAEAARQQRREAWIQLLTVLGNAMSEANNAVQQYAHSSSSSTTSYQSSALQSSSSGLSADDIHKIRDWQGRYKEWCKKSAHWISIFNEEQAWFRVYHKNIASFSRMELSSHQRRRTDAQNRVASCLDQMRNCRKMAEMSGGTILKAAAEAQAEVCVKQRLE